MADSILTLRSPAPADYYQNIFCSVFEFVLARFNGIVDDSIITALQSYLDASSDAQRLFARLLTRKGPSFLTASLKYTEVSQLGGAIGELNDLKLLKISSPVPADQLLGLLTKAQILDYFAVPKMVAKFTKGRIIEYVLGEGSDLQIFQRCSKYTHWITLTAPDHWWMISTLYFGNSGQDWSTFVRRDLGQLAYENVALQSQQFTTRQALQEHQEERFFSSLIYRLNEMPSIAEALLERLTSPTVANQESRLLQRLRQRNLLRLGKWAEKKELLGFALAAYLHTDIPPARERRVRILTKQKKFQGAATLLKEMKSAPISAPERLFVERFGVRGGGYQPPTTIIEIQSTPESVEDFVLLELIKEGGWGVHSENLMLKTLTGLVYWSICFAPINGAFTNPFQSGPHDLFETDFFLQRSEAIEALEASLLSDTDFIAHVRKIANEKQGVANRLVSWGLLKSVPIDDWLSAIPLAQLRQLSQFLIRNLTEYRRGFPDLFICYESGKVEYVEVKGPTDQLQPQQRAWFEEFNRMDVPARIIKLQLRQ